MTCKHDQGERISAADMLYVDGICPICLQAQLVKAEKVIEAVENFLDSTDNYSTAEFEEDLRDAIANFRSES